MAHTLLLEIFHRTNPTYGIEAFVKDALAVDKTLVRVAILHLDPFTSVDQALAAAYRASNSIDEPWFVERYADIQPESGQFRSTSIGDVIVVHPPVGSKTAYVCEPIGWKEVPYESLSFA